MLDLAGLADARDRRRRARRARGRRPHRRARSRPPPRRTASPSRFGDTASVGIGGLTLGGGVGYLVRKHGLTIDSLLGAEVVTADGRVLEVDADSHPDLFWAIRGGGGNFGVVTRFDYRLHPVDMVTGGMLALPATPETLAGLVAEAEAAPEELSVIANVLLAPPLPFVPPELVGKPLAARAARPRRAARRRGARPWRRSGRSRRRSPISSGRCRSARCSRRRRRPSRRARSMRTFFSDALDEAAAGELLDRLRASTAQAGGCADPRARRRGGARPVRGDGVRSPDSGG